MSLISQVLSNKGKVGIRPGTIPQETYNERFKTYHNEIFLDGEIAKCSSNVYAKIARELGITSKDPNKVVYLAAKRFVSQNKLNVLETKYESESSDEENSESDEKDENTNEYTIFDSNFEIHQDDKTFKINIKDIDLFSYSNGEIKLQSEWSDTLNEIIWEFSRYPCAWRFDRHKNVANEKLVFGTCRSSECNAKLFVYTEDKLSILKIVIKKFNPDAVHKGKRAVKYSNKKKIEDLLKLNKSSYVHAELSNAILESNDYCAAHLPNKATLNKIKQREKDTSLRDSDPIRSLSLLKTEAMFYKSITDIGVDPFYCFIGTPEQKEWLRLSTRYKRCVISIDSTGK